MKRWRTGVAIRDLEPSEPPALPPQGPPAAGSPAGSPGRDASPADALTIRAGHGFWRTAFQMFGPAYLVAVGYMDPGNWATDLAAGSRFGFGLLWVVALSSLMAMLLQSLCCRLGIATGQDLAQGCRLLLPASWRLPLWLLAEVAIVACDLAELEIGRAHV